MSINNVQSNQQVAQVDAILYKLRCYRTPQRVRSDVLDALRNYPSLQPRSGSIARATTPQTVLLYLAGTVPIFYNSVQYNIPVNIWIVENFPYSPPICHVTPTPDMVIKPKHKHVDSSGMCYLPYLSTWNPNNCNLTQLISTMSSVFGEDPPVRSNKSQNQPPPQPQQSQNVIPPYMSPSNQPQPNPYNLQYGNNSASQYPGQYPPNPNLSNTPYQSPIPTNYPPPSNYQQPQPLPGQGPIPQYPPKQGSNIAFEDPATVAKRNALRSVTEKTQHKLQEFFSSTTKQIDNQIVETGRLEDKLRNLNNEKLNIDLQQGQVTSDIDQLTKSFDDINKWIEQNDMANLDIDSITEPKDPYSKQLLYLVAEDATMEDTLYYLEKNLMSGELSLEVFLKNVRSLSTEQFLKRATIKKIHERQRSQTTK